MRKLLDKWRFYGLGEAEYRTCMEKVFAKNISGLCRTNIVVAVSLIIFLIVPLFIDRNLTKAVFFTGTIFFAMCIYIFVRCKYRQNDMEMKLNKGLIYTLIFITYANVMSLGIYLGVWANPEKLAGTFFALLICTLILFYIPPLFHYCLTVFSMIIFIVFNLINKTTAEHCIDIPNALFAGTMSMVFGWQIVMNRLSLASTANKMEDERNSYYDQSTVDELTQLKNRRDFLNSFQRFLASPRQSDNYLCIAIMDIDFFKSYNDYYGHPKGDECLRSIGKALNDLHNSMNIYAARIGGEEFALIWFEKETANAENVASLVSKMIHSLNIPHEKSDIAPYVTVSIGIYVVRCGVSDDINSLYNLADKALYTAKKNGRNRAVIDLSGQLHIEPLRETA